MSAISKIALAASVALALAACSSGGSSGGPSLPGGGNPGNHQGNGGSQGNNQGNGGNQGNNQGNQGQQAAVKGVRLAIDQQIVGGKEVITFDSKAIGFDTTAKNILIVDGKKIEVLPSSGIQSGGFTELNDRTANRIVSGNKYSYTRFGYYAPKVDGEYTGKNNMFANGDITKDVPTTGSASYRGDAVYGTERNQTAHMTTSEFEVNFGNKTIEGSIAKVEGGRYDLSAKINGNGFVGEKNGVKTEGRFFGPAAAELGGVFWNSTPGSKVAGSYGAKKQ